VIAGRADTWLTVDEFGAMIGREVKTVKNWISAGRLAVVDLFGVPLISLAMVEGMLAGAPPTPDRAALARTLIRRTDSRARTQTSATAGLTTSQHRGSM
jgi:hypothetical protein